MMKLFEEPISCTSFGEDFCLGAGMKGLIGLFGASSSFCPIVPSAQTVTTLSLLNYKIRMVETSFKNYAMEIALKK
jgi:hypothetical protein